MQFIVVAGAAFLLGKLVSVSSSAKNAPEHFTDNGILPKPATMDVNVGRGKFDRASGQYMAGTGSEPMFPPAKVESFYASEDILHPVVSIYHPDSGKNSDGYGLRPQVDHLFSDESGTTLFKYPNEIFNARTSSRQNRGNARRV